MPEDSHIPDAEHSLDSALADATRPTVRARGAPTDESTVTSGATTAPSPGRQELGDAVHGAQGLKASTETVHLHRGEVWGGDFQLGPLIGRGGMGAVYACRQLSLDRPVALKALRGHLSDDPELVARFEQEAKWLARISSPNVINVHAFGQHRNHHYLVMELVEGEDLAKKLKSGWRPGHAEAIDLIAQAARGLMAAGEHGIVHRDIKPGNMMLTLRGVLKLTDFGLARLVHGTGTLSSTGVILGTDAYMSPEQCQGRAVDQRSDIYSLGVVFYELLTGRRPFVGETHMEVFCQHLEREPPAPRSIDPTIPPEAETVTLHCLAKDPRDRYQTAADLLADLERVMVKQAPLAPPPRARSGGRTALMAAVLAVLALAAGWWWHSRETGLPREREAPAAAEAQRPAAPQQPAKEVPAPAELPSLPARAEPRNQLKDPAADTSAASPDLVRHEATFRNLRQQQLDHAPVRVLHGKLQTLLNEVQLCDKGEGLSASILPVCDALAWTERVEQPSWGALTYDDYGPLATVHTDDYELRFRWCPAGDFMRGSPENSPGHHPDETAQRVFIDHGFWIADAETTVAQWRAIIGAPHDGQALDAEPITWVAWQDADDFCTQLGRRLGAKVRLPTEAQWEYACRASGDPDPSTLARFGWIGSEKKRVQVVRSKQPNGWGIYDMHGNAAEWCADWYGPYGEAEIHDPTGPAQGGERVHRGGYVGEDDCRAATRFHEPADRRVELLGFRVIVSAE